MPLCKIRTSRLTYTELRRITGFGFPVVAFLKLLRCNFPDPARYLVPCLWQDMRASAETLSAEGHRHINAVRAELPADEGAWECHFLRRPHQSSMIVDSGGAFFFAPGARFNFLHAYAKTAAGSLVAFTYVASFRQNGHTVATTNNLRGFDPVPESFCHAMPGSTSELIQHHRTTIASLTDLVVFASFSDFTDAYDRKEKLQSDWDFERGAFAAVR